MSGQFLLTGLISGAIKKLKEDQPIIRASLMDPNAPGIVVCLNEGGGETPNARWYSVTVEEVDDPEVLDILNAMFRTKNLKDA